MLSSPGSHRRLTLRHQVNTGKYQSRRQQFLYRESVLPDSNGYYGGNNGLHIIVHADRSGTDVFQCHRDKHECDERGSKQQIKECAHLRYVESFPMEYGDVLHVRETKRSECQCGEQKHPFHHCHGRIVSGQRFGQDQIDGIHQLIQQHQCISPKAGSSVGSMCGVEHEQHSSTYAKKYAE